MTSPSRKRRNNFSRRTRIAARTEEQLARASAAEQKEQAKAEKSPFYQMTRSDSILIRRAVRQRWPTPQETRDRIVDEMSRALDPPQSGRDYLNALLCLSITRTVVAMREEEIKDRIAELKSIEKERNQAVKSAGQK